MKCYGKQNVYTKKAPFPEKALFFMLKEGSNGKNKKMK
jgi:hypothetical protein